MTKRRTTDEFIAKAKKKHGDKYDYSKVEYVNSNSKVIIICKTHGEFQQIANNHLYGKGCIKCARQYTPTFNEFVDNAKAMEIHKDKYDYPPDQEYINGKTKVIIICKTHGKFMQSPSDHLAGRGCQKCGRCYKPTFNEFVNNAKAMEIHKDKYYYPPDQEYINSHTKVIIICKIHGEFQQTPTDHLSGYGCIDCAGVRKRTHDEFCVEANNIHNSKYTYISTYQNRNTHIDILCPIHPDNHFSQLPSIHLNGSGCPKCGDDSTRKKLQMTTETFIRRSNVIHENTYIYTNVVLNNGCHSVLDIICAKHGNFTQKASDHLAGCGCPKCWKSNYSKQSISYLNFISAIHNIHIQHAENGNEYIIHGRLKADGYCQETNTIYEYHGDFWHGNPKRYDLSQINSVRNETFGELYQKTLEREKLIRDMGFNLVVMWERDWNQINNSIRILQRLFRSAYNM